MRWLNYPQIPPLSVSLTAYLVNPEPIGLFGRLDIAAAWLVWVAFNIRCCPIADITPLDYRNLSRLMTKPTKWHGCPGKTQISLGIRPIWSESSLCTQWVAKDPSFLHADREDPDQTGWMPRLIWVFARRTCHFVGFVMRRLILLVKSMVTIKS